MEMIIMIREKYLNDIRPFYDEDLIKVITGIRRCGKSTLLGQIVEELQNKIEEKILFTIWWDSKY